MTMKSLTNPEFTRLLEYALTLTDNSNDQISQVRIVYVSVLDILRHLENRTAQEFPHHRGSNLHPQALTLSQLIEHCGITQRLSPQQRREALTYFRLLATRTETQTGNKTGPAIDHFVRENCLEHDPVRSLISAALAQHQAPGAQGSLWNETDAALAQSQGRQPASTE